MTLLTLWHAINAVGMPSDKARPVATQPQLDTRNPTMITSPIASRRVGFDDCVE